MAAHGDLRRCWEQDLWAARLRGVLFFSLKTEPASRTLDGVPPAPRDPPPSRQGGENRRETPGPRVPRADAHPRRSASRPTRNREGHTSSS